MSATATPAKKIWTEAELQALPEDGFIHEVVNGELVMSPKNNFYQGAICSRLLAAMVNFNETQRLGAVLDSSTGFWMRNRNCRAPDISFITKARLRAAGFKRQTTRFFPGAPDLAVEILPQIMCAPKWTSGSRTSSPAAPKSPRSSIPPMSVSKSAIRPRNGS